MKNFLFIKNLIIVKANRSTELVVSSQALVDGIHKVYVKENVVYRKRKCRHWRHAMEHWSRAMPAMDGLYAWMYGNVCQRMPMYGTHRLSLTTDAIESIQIGLILGIEFIGITSDHFLQPTLYWVKTREKISSDNVFDFWSQVMKTKHQWLSLDSPLV